MTDSSMPEHPTSSPLAAVPPDPRVLFAAERTLLAWIRTGLAMMGFGFVVARFGLFLRELAAGAEATGAPRVTSTGLSLVIGVALVGLGVVVNALGVWEYQQRLVRLNRGESFFPASRSPAAIIAGVLALLGVAIAVYLVLVAR